MILNFGKKKVLSLFNFALKEIKLLPPTLGSELNSWCWATMDKREMKKPLESKAYAKIETYWVIDKGRRGS